MCVRKDLFSVMFVRNGELLPAASTTRRQYTATVLRCHSLAEAVLVHSSSVVRLKCSFHFLSYLFVIDLLIRPKASETATYKPSALGCKITHNFRITKELNEFSVTI